MKENICYRMSTESDIHQLVHLRLLMQKEVHSAQDFDIDADFLLRVKKYFEKSMPAGNYYSAVAEIDKTIIAATGIVIYEKPPSLKGKSGLVGYITNVYTLPEYRKLGIAEKLMKLTLDRAREVGVEKLHLTSTVDGKGVYERVGFTPVRLASLDLSL